MESLSGKVALVTGGTRGIGRAIAERLLREGAAVGICGRSQDSAVDAASRLAPLGRALGCGADVTDPSQVNRMFRAIEEHLGGLDILVNNAGAAVFKKAGEMSLEEWHRNVDLNLNGAFYCSREALSAFQKRGGGFIVNISSLAGKNAFSGGAAYNASKFGLNGFTEAMMLDHRFDNVRVSCIMPGSVDTEFSGPVAPGSEWKIAPEDVAEVVAAVLRMPQRTLVSRVEMRPSRPKG